MKITHSVICFVISYTAELFPKILTQSLKKKNYTIIISFTEFKTWCAKWNIIAADELYIYEGIVFVQFRMGDQTLNNSNRQYKKNSK